MNLDQGYWNRRYLENDTPWDIGDVSPPLKAFFDQLPDKDLKILIPGAGKAHEAEYLWHMGFSQVYVCDWADEAFLDFRNKLPEFPPSNILIDDFFRLDMEFDLLVEQTFFCALHPSKRSDYVSKVSEILRKNGKVVGLLFATEFQFDGPPFGGTKSEYLNLFQPKFTVFEIEEAPNSISPRLGNELFFRMKKK